MEGSDHGGGSSAAGSLPPFLIKTYEMVDDPATDDVVSWTPTGASFVVSKPLEFARDLLPKYFKHNNFSSFVRQLNTYGFRKSDPEQWEFSNEDFIRGQRHQLKNIHRRKPIFSHSSHTQGTGLAEAERKDLEEEIERLKCDKSSLVMELQKNAHKKLEMDHRMQYLEEKLLVLEDRQRNLIAYLRQIVRTPGFLSNLVEQSDHHSKKRRLPKTIFFHEDASIEENQVLRHPALNRDTSPVHTLNTESFDKMESSLNSLETFLRGASEAFGDDMSYDNTVPCAPSAVILTEMHASSGDTNRSLPSPSSKMLTASPCVADTHSSPDLAESTSCAESPPLPLTDSCVDTRGKVSTIDVNSEPAVTEAGLSRDRLEATAAPPVPAGKNDVFWEQFFTEQPGSSDVQEVQSERRDANDNRNEMKTGDRENFWWSRKNVDHITEKMGHLTSVEKT